MSGGSVLAELMAQGVREGTDLVTLRAIAEEAGELGATRALARMGLSDERAQADVKELRELLTAWREAKSSAWKAVVGWVMRLGCALLLAGLAMRLGFQEWLK
ncbi:hypothetical protein KCP91_10370 [Microvirga sp. SRT01]|jgi:hypothetical protein|uniref:DUF1640 domain-containing protein n=1 Tax=Sphingomonas longa TaxID=2778730 RepID=A0ABS2D775_9SPHN|nr:MULTISPECIES: DUF6127 family protein [Alphaproteobacteria]MBM6576780.1 hypothetical protein [Sphingomonas sp. BT552]MBR7709825.1 hypothetical protein [Microvirga sp. SRT01]